MQEIVIANEIASISCMAYYGLLDGSLLRIFGFHSLWLVILIPCQPVFQ